MALLVSCPTCTGTFRVSPVDVRKERIMVCMEGHFVQLRNVVAPAAAPAAPAALTRA